MTTQASGVAKPLYNTYAVSVDTDQSKEEIEQRLETMNGSGPLSYFEPVAMMRIQSQSPILSPQPTQMNFDIPGDCIPLVQDGDIDNDGLANNAENELDIDGDGILDENDGDIDGDCMANNDPQEQDIDGDGKENGKDSNCN
jgi:hypothetical protein